MEPRAQSSPPSRHNGHTLVSACRTVRVRILRQVAHGHPENALTKDEMLDDVTLYWLTRTGASAARLYWESIRQVQEVFGGGTSDLVTVPTGCSIFPGEIIRPSRRWVARRFTDIRYWNELDRGQAGELSLFATGQDTRAAA